MRHRNSLLVHGPGILAAIKFGKMTKNRLDKYLANLNGVCVSAQTEVNGYHRWHRVHSATCHWHPGQVDYPDTQQTSWP